jgi:ASC-1-like (ASCH) protein
MIVSKKISPKFYKLIKSDKKKFEVRLADFKIKPGDTLVLVEYNTKRKPTGRQLKRKVKYVYKFKLNDFGQAKEIKKYGLYVIQF